ncbi:hypothetical protein DSAG12_01238 [Promethearchaeum syntrophicum]|uniref:Uncharacterized protein n=1 Tax=Promethearchaeum syntrophicum TaxID=2594042 RepID=A0A5B9D8M0_9ARCH|nr:hypothetical protein [Candidatus Prometheoarchaeum syntrophicum]QEE15413.1 hypothetical protein DSAG12_01238 [Candidatus Prometheoarchaeum syntrophicum]
MLKNENIFLKSNEIKFNFRKNKDSLILSPIIISEDGANQILKKISDILNELQVFDENYINFDDRSEIEEIFGLPYRETFACFGYLIKQDKIKIVNSSGSKVLFEIIE